MNKVNSKQGTLAMFFDEPAQVWSEEHKKVLIKLWKKFGVNHQLSAYNKEFHTNLLRQQNDADLIYRANAGIPFYSDYAKEVALERGLM